MFVPFDRGNDERARNRQPTRHHRPGGTTMMTVMKASAFAVGVAALVATAVTLPAAAEDTIGTIKQRGELICGVDPGVPGYSMPDANGNYQGLDIDLCKAVATAILGDGAKIKYVPLSTSARFAAL